MTLNLQSLKTTGDYIMKGDLTVLLSNNSG